MIEVSPDPFYLERFLQAQAGAISAARAEIAAGRKSSHWMWFVFPQIAGLGSSAMARRYAIGSKAEARAYLAHPVLETRLRELTASALACPSTSAHALFGSPDDLKFRSCMTLFAAVAEDPAPFKSALDRFFAGAPDQATLHRLSTEPL